MYILRDIIYPDANGTSVADLIILNTNNCNMMKLIKLKYCQYDLCKVALQ